MSGAQPNCPASLIVLVFSISEVGGSEGCQGLPPVTGKSFRFVRACARCGCEVGMSLKSHAPRFPFSLCPVEVFPFPFLCRVFPFSLESKSDVKVKSKCTQSVIKVKSL